MVSDVLFVPSVLNRWVPHPWSLRVRFFSCIVWGPSLQRRLTRQSFSWVSTGRLLRRADLDSTHSSVYAIPQFPRVFPHRYSLGKFHNEVPEYYGSHESLLKK
jgi:hypothetical protein